MSLTIDPSVLTMPASQLPNISGGGIALGAPLTIGTAYTFTNVGDQVPMHTHPPGTNHFTIVAFGSVTYDVQNPDSTVSHTQYDAPAILNVPVGQAHSFTGLTPGAVVFNLLAAILDPPTIKAMVQGLAADMASLQTALTNVQNLTA